MIVIVKGGQPLCWMCKQPDHLTKVFPQKTGKDPSNTSCNTLSDHPSDVPVKAAKTDPPATAVETANRKEGWTEVAQNR